VSRFEELGEAGQSDQRFHPEARKVTPELMNYLLSLLEESPRSLGWQRSTWTLELMALQVEDWMGVRPVQWTSDLMRLASILGVNATEVQASTSSKMLREPCGL
jgi:hypothetical protein